MNESKPQITREIVFAYFAHLATPIERQQIESWLKTREGSETYYTYLDEWERQFPQFQPNLEDARASFNLFMRGDGSAVSSDAADEPLPMVIPVSEIRRPVWQRAGIFLSAVAASAVLVAGMWLSKDLWYYQRMTSRHGQTLSIRLHDGSEVQLGAHSSLKYPRFWFGKNTRYVWLEGDAEFKVAHLPDAQRFIVYTPDQTAIEVLGTEFLVNCRLKSTKVLLRTGSIRLTNPMAAQPLLLKPGDLVTVSDEKKIQKEHRVVQAAEQKGEVRKFLFKNTSLKEIADQLNDVYGVNVRIAEPALLTRTVSGTFQAETAADLLEALSEMMTLDLKQTTDGYTLQQRSE
ncbi:FecR family protein [Dyadobacter sandarakinus]|uniref:FecR domain-containing protein n=1 Tax=Dyadobacter sandarakinus TaxID=2747268 RepID=A0ABX7I291_9BACT|nr:FecR domain-containing protein [Dyadobacter sandarakinus]QRR00184.1 FecR domain-containing protein [Dyadobacter sandarakinus]